MFECLIHIILGELTIEPNIIGGMLVDILYDSRINEIRYGFGLGVNKGLIIFNIFLFVQPNSEQTT